MRVIQVCSSFLPNIGGKEVVLHNLLKTYRSIENIESRLVRFGGFSYRMSHAFPYTYHAFPRLFKSMNRNIAYGLFVEKLLFNFNIVHLHGIYPLGSILADYKKKLGYKLILTPHGEDIQKMPEIGYGVRLRPKVEAEIANILRAADAITAISPIIEQEIESLHQHSVLIPNGVDTKSIFRPQLKAHESITREKLGLKEGAKIILAVGRNHPKKGFDVLIKALPLVVKEEPAAHLVIVGAQCEDHRSLIQLLQMEQAVTLTGRIPKESAFDPIDFEAPNGELIGYYHLCDIFVMSSFIESFGVVTVEAMAAGKPVIATNLSGKGDASGAVTDGYNGFLVEPGNSEQMAKKTITLLKNDVLRHNMGKKALKTAKMFDWSEVARQYIHLYQNC